MAKAKSSVAVQALPFFAFIIAAWYGVATVEQNKRDLRVSVAAICTRCTLAACMRCSAY